MAQRKTPPVVGTGSSFLIARQATKSSDVQPAAFTTATTATFAFAITWTAAAFAVTITRATAAAFAVTISRTVAAAFAIAIASLATPL
ncbi:MAG: hypothetical protein MI741_21490, partial [Rhodospirillales bacterium]|nr:hypothetical protein [Rhodospirillales bacterium]